MYNYHLWFRRRQLVVLGAHWLIWTSRPIHLPVQLAVGSTELYFSLTNSNCAWDRRRLPKFSHDLLQFSNSSVISLLFLSHSAINDVCLVLWLSCLFLLQLLCYLSLLNCAHEIMAQAHLPVPRHADKERLRFGATSRFTLASYLHKTTYARVSASASLPS